ncbi:TolB-like translocation protein [Flavitalea flava]
MNILLFKLISGNHKVFSMIFNRLTVCLLFLLYSLGSSAQQFGGNPPSLKWKQINTDTARIIFPAGLDSQAQQVAAIVHRLSRTTLPTIGGKQQKIDIVLQNQTIIPNGYVGLAPFRSEFQLTPEQNSLELGSLPWQKLLAIHEYRHVQQYNNYRVGLSSAFYYLFGEGGQALANSLAIPNWFWEGDAVYQETLVSDQGRGRQPYFFNSYRSLWAGDKDYSWMKLRNGSLRDYVPDHYPMGYMLVAYGRQRYGDLFWEKVTLDAAAFKGLFYPLQKAIEKHAGISFLQFRQDALNYFRKPLENEHALTDDYARKNKHFLANEEFPQLLGKDSILYMRSSYKKIPSFVIRDLKSGKEKKLGTRAISLDNYFSCRNGRVVYAAYESDPRWGWRDYSVIRVLDVQTGKDAAITSRSRYFAPDISADGSQIITVQEGANGTCALHVLNGQTGSLEKDIPNKDSLFYTYPKFYTKEKIVTAVRNTKGEMALATVNLKEGITSYLSPFSFQTIAYPSISGDTIWFTASHNGRDRIYAFAGEHLFLVRLSGDDLSTGQYAFQADNGRYAWSNFSAVGYRMITINPEHLRLEPISAKDWMESLPDQGIDSLNSGPVHLLDKIGTEAYPVKPYPASYRLLNFHSWRPFINDPDYTFSLVSENILNTLQSEVFVNYNRNEQYKQIGVDATYGKLFPWIDIGGDYIFDRNTLFRNGKIYWNQADAYGGLSIPLSFTRNKSTTNLQLGSDLVFQKDYFTGFYKDSLNDRQFTYLRNYLSFSNQIQQSKQQIYPRLAQTLFVGYNHSVGSLNAYQFLASGNLYLPGAAFTHNIVLGAAFQEHDKGNNGGFSNSFPFSRGYSAENFYQMYRLTGNYHIPLVYPDWGIGNIVYFLRIRANLYYDYTKVWGFTRTGGTANAYFRSYGSEVYFDTKWWNQLSVGFGIRYSRLVDPDYEGRGPNQWELILPINLLGK